jgi:hypothetical protein
VSQFQTITLKHRENSFSQRRNFGIICKNFRCVMCGRRGAVLNMPSVEHESKSFRAFPIERPVSVGGVRLSQESCNAQGERCAAVYADRRQVWSQFWPC